MLLTRTLYTKIAGEDVGELHQVLTQLGYAIREGELTKEYFGRDTKKAVKAFQKEQSLESTGIVDDTTVQFLTEATTTNPVTNGKLYVITGQVQLPHDRPAPTNCQVCVCARQVGKEPTELHRVPVNKQGAYQLSFAQTKWNSWSNQAGAALTVDVLDSKGISFGSGQTVNPEQLKHTVDFTVTPKNYKRPTGFQLVKDDLELALNGKSLGDLDEEDVKFLAQYTPASEQQIRHAAEGVRCEKASKEMGQSIDAEIFYGFACENLLSNLTGLLIQDPSIQRRSLQNAIEQQHIAASYKGKVGKIIDSLHELRITQALELAPVGQPASHGDLLALTSLTGPKKRTFLSLYFQHEHSDQDRWETVAKQRGFTNATVTQLRGLYDLAGVSRYHLPLIKACEPDIKKEGLRALAGWDAAAWKRKLNQKVKGKVIGIPPGVEGTTDAERINRYAQELEDKVEEAYPSATLLAQVKKVPKKDLPEKTLLETFLEQNPNFEFRKEWVEDYLAHQSRTAMKGVANNKKEPLKEQLFKWERLYKVCTSCQQMVRLAKHGFGSAREIATMGRESFVRQVTPTFSPEVAKGIHASARREAETVMAVLPMMWDTMDQTLPRVIGDRPPLPTIMNDTPKTTHSRKAATAKNAATTEQTIPDWRTLFGSLDLCACEHCQSVYSPAAYFVDLLQFLDKQKTKKDTEKSALDVLLRRRPDLQHIALTCENTNTPLPYIDLVNEVLEHNIHQREFKSTKIIHQSKLVEGDPHPDLKEELLKFGYVITDDAQISIKKVRDSVTGEWIPSKVRYLTDIQWFFEIRPWSFTGRRQVFAFPQTSWKDSELQTNPEHINVGAYDEIRKYLYPWDLPHNHWTEESCQWLEHLGMPMYEILDRINVKADRKPLDHELAVLDYIGLSEEMAKVITENKANVESALWNFYGFSKKDSPVPDPLDRTKKITGNWLNTLEDRVDVFLQQTGLSYAELKELLATRFINSAGNVKFISQDAATCELDKISIGGLNLVVLDKVHRFVRLARALDWHVFDLDRAIETFQASDVDQSILKHLAQVQWLKKTLNIPLREILCWWGRTFDTKEYTDANDDVVPSWYDEVFLNKSVLNPNNDQFKLYNDRTELAKADQELEETLPSLCATLAIDAETLALFVEEIKPVVQANNGNLNLAIIHQLYRHTSLCKALKLSGRDFLNMKLLIEIDPFQKPMDTILFLEKVEKVKGSSFSIAELRYLLRNESTPEADVALTAEHLSQALEGLRLGLGKPSAEIRAGSEEPERTLAQSLREFGWKESWIIDLIMLLKGEITYTVPVSKPRKKIVIPPKLENKVHYDTKQEKLTVSGLLTDDIYEQLKKLNAGSGSFLTVLDLIRDAITEFFISYLVIDGPQVHRVRLDRLPSNFTIPQHLETRLRYDQTNKHLECVGALSSLDVRLLIDLSDRVYSSVLGRLYEKSREVLDPRFRFQQSQPFIKYSEGYRSISEDDIKYFSSTGVENLSRILEVLGWAKETVAFAQKAKDWIPHYLSTQLDLDHSIIQLLWGNSKVNPVYGFLDQKYYFENQGSDLTSQDWIHVASYNAFHKANILVKNLQLTFEDIDGMVRAIGEGGLGFLDFQNLQSISMGALFPNFDILTDFLDAMNLAKIWLIGLPSVWETFGQLASFASTDQRREDGQNVKEAFFRSLSAHPNIHLEDLRVALGEESDPSDDNLLGIATPQAFDEKEGNYVGKNVWKDRGAWLRVKRFFDMLKELGVSAKQVKEWVDGYGEYQVARSIKQAVKAKYDLEQWTRIAEPIRQSLSEKRRDALVSSLLGSSVRGSDGRDYKDKNDIYGHFLIDVEMNPCMKTSRIKQGLSSIQLFIQRMQMGLEPEVEMDEELAEQWKWMKNYRVWEANRKVFLYPENWIEPELRDDKSPFFEEMEHELLQSELTLESVETAYRNYLEKLQEVARLEIVGLYEEHFRNDETYKIEETVLHVFARTYDVPHIYYYRRRHKIENSSYWTPWEKMDVDIEGDHLIPAVMNRRLYLFWPEFRKKAEATRGPTGGLPRKWWEISLSWCKYSNRKWQPRKVSTKKIPSFVDLKTADGVVKYLIFKGQKEEYLFLLSHIAEDTIGLHVIQEPRNNKEGSRTIPYYERFRIRESGNKVKLEEVGSDSLFGGRTVPMHTPWNMKFVYKDELFTADKTPGLLLPINVKHQKENLVRPLDNHKFERVLDRLPSPSRILFSPFTYQRSIKESFFYEDETNTFFVETFVTGYMPRFRFWNFSQTFFNTLTNLVDKYGAKGILDSESDSRLNRQILTREFFNWTYYQPNDNYVLQPYPVDRFEFDAPEPYSLYNWELFFHAPLLVADRLTKERKFEDAQKWFHYIFSPMGAPLPKTGIPNNMDVKTSWAKYWRFRPFLEKGKPRTISELLKLLHYTGDDPSKVREKENLETAIERWRRHTFQPHLVARTRIGAYQKTTVMKYLDNLIAWGDDLFRRDSIESLNEATQLYILAAEILGERPKTIPPRVKRSSQTYSQLAGRELDEFSNAVVNLENRVRTARARIMDEDDYSSWRYTSVNHTDSNPSNSSGEGLGQRPDVYSYRGIRSSSAYDSVNSVIGQSLYFCIPRNEKLLAYWDMVEDRLLKIRHCLNIEGQARQLALFEPPIDPALLVRARALGIDIGEAIRDLDAPIPTYRFQVMWQKAVDLCREVQSLGGAMLSALEKRDAEGLALLRAGHEIAMLKRVTEIRKKQIKETQESLEGLRHSKGLVETRREFFKTRVEGKLSSGEKDQLAKLRVVYGLHIAQAVTHGLMIVNHLIPEGKIGLPTTAGFTYGGRNLGSAASAFSGLLGSTASVLTTKGTMSSIKAGHERREQDWAHQWNLAEQELKQMDKQIAAAEIRLAIAEKELANHEQQISNARAVDEYMRDKFTNQELYSWMTGQVSGLYFQSYRLAYDVAKQAEKAYRFELDIHDSDFIQFGYWDSLKKGLLAGERLLHDLKRMEVAYTEQNTRRKELTKHISLRQLNPLALTLLKQTGACYVDLPEELFDLDSPGHYLRRIKTVAVSIPCVTGPFTSVNLTLTLQNHSIRKNSRLINSTDYSRDPKGDDRFFDSNGVNASIVTSRTQQDGGLFEVNLRDEQYLPFEGAGAISTWQLELPNQFRQFDYETISDVILHLRYTARDGGDIFKGKAEENLVTTIKQLVEVKVDQETVEATGLFLSFSARYDFPHEWQQFLYPVIPAGKTPLTQEFQLPFEKERFPYLFQSLPITITALHFFLRLKDDVNYKDEKSLKFLLDDPMGSPIKVNEPRENGEDEKVHWFTKSGSLISEVPFSKLSTGTRKPGAWTLKVTKPADVKNLPAWRHTVNVHGETHYPLNPDAIEDLLIFCQYEVDTTNT